MHPPRPAAPEAERALWYQWYFNTERGRLGLAANRRSLCRLLWETWSPTWKFSAETFDRTAASFDNPDFVDVVIHSYRHRNGNAPADAARRHPRTPKSGARNVRATPKSRAPQCRVAAGSSAPQYHQNFSAAALARA